MYKIILFFLLLAITPLVFPQQYYKSNKLGMELTRIDKYRTDEFEYYIEKIKGENRELKILFKESVPVKETELYYSIDGVVEKEIIIENGIKTERTYKESLVTSERIININDNSGYVKKYKYNSKQLLDTVDELSLDGKLETSVTYERDSKGRIASVIKSIYSTDNTKKEDQISKYRFEEQNLLEEWHGSSDLTGKFIYYNSNGKISGVVKKDKGKTISEKKYFYDADFNLKTEEFIHETGEKIVQNITSDGYLTEEVIYIGENFVSRINDYYDDDKMLTRRVKVTPKGVERYVYEYLDDKLSSEKIYFNGEIYKEKVYNVNEDNEYYEDLYNNGRKTLRIYYKDDEKVSTERW